MLSLKKVLSLAGGVIAVLITVICFEYVQADTVSAWLSPASLNLQKQSGLSSIPQSINGNIDCFAESNGICAVNTKYGTANTTGSVRLANSSDYRPVVSAIDNHQRFIAIPNSSTFITYTTEPADGFYLYFNYNFSSAITPLNNGLGPYLQVSRQPDGKLTDKAGHRLAADSTSISFSENGEWMVVSEPNIAMLRVNLQTFEVLPFATGFNYEIGLNPGPQTAITNDGRYAVVASKDFNRFAIYDLQTCEAVPSTITGSVSCQSRDLQDFIGEQVSGFNSVSNLRFISDDTIGLYASYNQGSTNKNAKYILSTMDGAVHQQDYLALGDSYISGEGAFHYLQGTDTNNNQCHVSLASYPYLLGEELNYNSFHSVACSGAETTDVIDTSKGYRGQAKPSPTRQNLEDSNRISTIITNFQQGYIDQLDFVKQYQPKIITISISGNDIGFSARLRQCLGSGSCYGTYEDRLEFVREVNHAFPKLVDTYTKLKSAGAADARIYVIGYPQIAKPGGDCAVNVHMSNDELMFVQYAVDYLDTVIKNAAAKTGVFYVDTQDSFFGHRLCEAGPGSVAMNGITAGNDFPDILGGPIGRESYHPNAFGYQLLENKILSATQNMTALMPSPDLTAAPPAESGLEMLNVARSNREVKVTEYDSGMMPDFALHQDSVELNVDGARHAIPANATFQIELHSDSTSLGVVTSDDIGNVKGEVIFPANLQPGYHTLHLLGTDITGQKIDIFKIIYVGSSTEDLDGDGVADSTQKCVGVIASGLDADQDGIDDSCDGTIDLAAQNGTRQILVKLGSVSTTRPTPISAAASSSNGSSSPVPETDEAESVLSDSTDKQFQPIIKATQPVRLNVDSLRQSWPEAAASSVFVALTLTYFWKRLPD
jgi:lysophospholipase L1-like esterase